MGEAAKMIDADERADVRDGSRLLARIARRDADALAELYRMWGDRLFSMALHWLKDGARRRKHCKIACCGSGKKLRISTQRKAVASPGAR